MLKQCHRCHKEFSPDELKFIRGKDIYVCGDCAEEKFTQCDVCHKHFSDKDLVYTNNSKSVCVWCVSEKYVLCPHCGSFIPEAKAVNFHGHYMCADCKKEYFEKCGICKKQFEADDGEEVKRNNRYIKICPECLQRQYVCCESCSEYISKTATHEHDGKFYCPGCFKDDFVKCQSCGKTVLYNVAECLTVCGRDLKVCPDCVNKYDDCAGYYNTLPKEQLYALNGDNYCRSCLQKVMSQMEELERRQALLNLGAAAVGLFAGTKLANWLSGSSVSYNTPSSSYNADYESFLSDAEDVIGDDYVGDGLDGFDGGEE